MNSLSLIRTDHSEEQIIGKLFVLDHHANILFECHTLELPWKNNERRISCIPTGRYRVRPRISQKYGKHLHILDVPGRDMILIHEANFVHQLLGCIAVGQSVKDLNGDGLNDITSSKLTKAKLLEYIDSEIEIVIT